MHIRHLPAAIALTAAVAANAAPQAERKPRVGEGQVLVVIRFDADYQRLDELRRRYDAEIVRFERPFLHLVVARSQLAALRQGGHQPRVEDPDAFFEDHVRIEPISEDVLARVRKLGGRLVQREDGYAVVRVTRRELETIRQAGIQAREIREADLRPLFVEIAVSDESTMNLVQSLGIDIFEVRGGILLGRAYDEQIEELRGQGIEVKRLPRPSAPPR